MPAERILAVDYGDKRTGLAISDPSGTLASPAGLLIESCAERTADKVVLAAHTHGATTILLGFPKNMDNSIGPRASKTLEFCELIRQRFDGSVVLRDERNTTLSAQRLLSETNTYGKKRRKVIDELSAVILLQDYLDSFILSKE